MVIYLDITTTLRTGALTGIQRVVIEYLKALRASPSAVTVKALRVEKGRLLEVAPAEVDRLLLRGSRSRPSSRRGRAWRMWAGGHGGREITALEPDAILFAPEVFDLGLLDHLHLFSSRVAMIHDLSALKNPQWVTSAKIAAYYPRYLQAAARFDKIVVPSLATRTDLERYWAFLDLPARPPIAVVPHGVALPPADFANDPAAPKNLLCLGSLEARKNHLALLLACEKLWESGEDFTLTIVGMETASGADAVRKIQQLVKDGRPVVWRGTLSDAELAALWSRAWAFAYPSHEEGFGLPVAESLARGVPVVCGTGGALAERVHFGGCEECEAVTPDSLAHALKNILNDSHRATLAREARATPRRDWPSAAKDFLEALKR